jgi:hypothetical protein
LVDRLRQNNCPVPELNDDKIYAVPSFAVIPASSHQNSTNASLNGNMELNTTIASEHSSNHDISPLDELKNELDEPHSHEALEMNDDSCNCLKCI